MTRPFPGIDPYLELPPFWGDFAPTLLASIRNQLLEHLLPDYDVRMEEYLMLTFLSAVTNEPFLASRAASAPGQNRTRMSPGADALRLAKSLETHRTPNWWSDGSGRSGTAVLEPATTEMEYPEFEPRTERHLQIIHRPTERVVTVMELLSPSNKAPGQDGLGKYLDKRNEFLSNGCHLIELDLLRGGQRLPMFGTLPNGDYFALIGRVGRKPRCQVIGWPLQAKLPALPVPLLPDDPEAILDLDAAFGTAYESSFYSRRLPYHEPLAPPLREADAAWVRERLQESGLPTEIRNPQDSV